MPSEFIVYASPKPFVGSDAPVFRSMYWTGEMSPWNHSPTSSDGVGVFFAASEKSWHPAVKQQINNEEKQILFINFGSISVPFFRLIFSQPPSGFVHNFPVFLHFQGTV